MNETKTTLTDEEIEKLIRKGREPEPVEIFSIEERIDEYSQQEFKPVRFGELYVFDLFIDGLPNRLVISPLPKDKAFVYKNREVAAKGWFARAKTARAVMELVGVAEHALSERRVGVYLLLMSDGMVEHGVSPRDLADSITEADLSRKVEEYDPYLTLKVKLKLDDTKQSLEKYEDRRYRDDEDYHDTGERYFRDAAVAFTEAFQAAFTVYQRLTKGRMGWLPDWDTVKRYLPWILFMVFVIAAGLYILTAFSADRRRLIMEIPQMLMMLTGWGI